jgi:hypothetical protein
MFRWHSKGVCVNSGFMWLLFYLDEATAIVFLFICVQSVKRHNLLRQALPRLQVNTSVLAGTVFDQQGKNTSFKI